eukprot:m51a1_g1994 hypothetical protein (382) ;mRNA; r:1200760-1202414
MSEDAAPSNVGFEQPPSEELWAPGDSYSLPESALQPGSLITVGLQWDPVGTENDQDDLDIEAACLVFGADGSLLEAVTPRRGISRVCRGGLWLAPDGAGERETLETTPGTHEGGWARHPRLWALGDDTRFCMLPSKAFCLGAASTTTLHNPLASDAAAAGGPGTLAVARSVVFAVTLCSRWAHFGFVKNLVARLVVSQHVDKHVRQSLGSPACSSPGLPMSATSSPAAATRLSFQATRPDLQPRELCRYTMPARDEARRSCAVLLAKIEHDSAQGLTFTALGRPVHGCTVAQAAAAASQYALSEGRPVKASACARLSRAALQVARDKSPRPADAAGAPGAAAEGPEEERKPRNSMDELESTKLQQQFQEEAERNGGKCVCM